MILVILLTFNSFVFIGYDLDKKCEKSKTEFCKVRLNKTSVK